MFTFSREDPEKSGGQTQPAELPPFLKLIWRLGIGSLNPGENPGGHLVLEPGEKKHGLVIGITKSYSSGVRYTPYHKSHTRHATRTCHVHHVTSATRTGTGKTGSRSYPPSRGLLKCPSRGGKNGSRLSSVRCVFRSTEANLGCVIGHMNTANHHGYRGITVGIDLPSFHPSSLNHHHCPYLFDSSSNTNCSHPRAIQCHPPPSPIGIHSWWETTKS